MVFYNFYYYLKLKFYIPDIFLCFDIKKIKIKIKIKIKTYFNIFLNKKHFKKQIYKPLIPWLPEYNLKRRENIPGHQDNDYSRCTFQVYILYKKKAPNQSRQSKIKI
jgi:hypothetical protein